jgi:hypothetical protein
MKLLVDELTDSLEQVFNLTDNRTHHLKAIRPYLYVHNNPSGTFTLEVLSGSNVLDSVSFTSYDLYNSLNTEDLYAHLLYRVDLNKTLPLKKGTYKLKLSSSGYIYSDSSFLGWVKEHENLKGEVNGVPSSDSQNPLTFELVEYENS